MSSCISDKEKNSNLSFTPTLPGGEADGEQVYSLCLCVYMNSCFLGYSNCLGSQDQGDITYDKIWFTFDRGFRWCPGSN